MKKISLFAIVGLSFLTNSAFSQDTTRTLFSTPKINTLGLYVAPEYQFGQIQNELTHLSGFSAMAIVNKKLAVGVSMNRTLVRDFSPKDVSPLYLKANYGGLKIEYTVNPNSLFHISFPLMIGMGMASTDSISGSGIMRDTFRIGRNFK